MILSTILLLTLQSGDFDTAIADSAALAAKNNFTGAVQLLKDAGVEDSSDATAWSAYGEMTAKWTEFEISAGRIAGLDAYDSWNDVAWIYEKTSAMSGATDIVWVNWSEALLNANDVNNSLSIVKAGLSKSPKSSPLLLQKGRVMMSSARASADVGAKKDATRDFAIAETSFRKAMDVAPETAAPCLRLAELQWTLYYDGAGRDQELHDEAIRNFKLAAEREATAVDSGMISSWLGVEGIPILDILIAKQPEELNHYWYRGSAYYNMGPDHWPEIRDDFLKVIELNPRFTNAYYFLADGAMQRGKQLDGSDNPTDRDRAYGAAAKFWAAYLKDFGPTYRASVNQNEGGAKLAADTMNWLAGNSSMHDGIVLLKWAVKTQPDFGDAWNNLAFFYRETNQAGKSRDAYAKALEFKPNDPQVMNDYAVIFHYYLRTEDDFARELYEKAAARAQEMIDNDEIEDGDEDRIRTALRDANNNLRRLASGNRENN